MEVFEDFISLFFPRYCTGCHQHLVKGEVVLCTNCIRDLPRTDFHAHRNNPLYHRLYGRIPVRHALAFLRFEKGTMVQHLLHALKYQNRPEVGLVLGRVYGQDLIERGLRFDMVVPVPLHSTRMRTRGYNQSVSFAHGICEVMAIPCLDGRLVRQEDTSSQTRKTRLSRWVNVRDAFAAPEPSVFINKDVLLVDDVVTTGATMEACGRVIFDSGCASLSVACIAVA